MCEIKKSTGRWILTKGQLGGVYERHWMNIDLSVWWFLCMFVGVRTYMTEWIVCLFARLLLQLGIFDEHSLDFILISRTVFATACPSVRTDSQSMRGMIFELAQNQVSNRTMCHLQSCKKESGPKVFESVSSGWETWSNHIKPNVHSNPISVSNQTSCGSVAKSSELMSWYLGSAVSHVARQGPNHGTKPLPKLVQVNRLFNDCKLYILYTYTWYLYVYMCMMAVPKDLKVYGAAAHETHL